MPVDKKLMDSILHEHLFDKTGDAPPYSTDDAYCGDIVSALKKKGARVTEGMTEVAHMYYLDVSGGRMVSTMPMSRSKADAYSYAAVSALGMLVDCMRNRDEIRRLR